MSAPSAVLRLDEVTIGYRSPRGAERVIAAHLNAELRVGAFVCLLGPNGAGKSTLMRTAAGMQSPLAGSVWLQGRPLPAYSALELAQQLAVVLTERVDVPNLSAYGLVALGRHPYTDWSGRLTSADEEVIRWALTVTGAASLAGRAVNELSDGERQRVMIARALAQEPEVIILDEPTAFLDLPRRVEIMRLLRTLAHETGKVILLSTHDLDLALRSADQVWLIAPGGKFYMGTPEELVLDGSFEMAFQSEGVMFDPVTGSFRLSNAQARTVTLAGDGLPFIWTGRALERLGFVVTHVEHRPSVESRSWHVQVIDSGEGTRWQVYQGGQCTEFTTLNAALVRLQSFADGG